ncbi:MAG TPA: pYEATS domain-containing protein [Leptolyngbyaceae cyanobacterium]
MGKLNTFYIAQSTPSPSSPTSGKGGTFDSGWVPLFQTLAWIVFWAMLMRYIHRNFKSQVGELLSAFVTRIQQGSPIQAGTFSLGAPPAIASQQVTTATSEGTEGVSLPENQHEQVLHYQQYSKGITEEVYLIHTSEVITPKTENLREKYRVRVWLEAYTEFDFNECEKVIYRLHESFSHQVIATEAKNNQFELWLNLWGEFTIIACVKRKDKEALWLTRYLDLPGRPSG